MPVSHYMNLDELHGYPPSLQWHAPNVDGWRAVYEQFGIVRPLVFNVVTGNVLNPPGELEALAVSRQSGAPIPNGARAESDAWSVPVWAVAATAENETAISLILSGGVDRALAPRLKDGSVLGILIDSAEKNFEDAKAFGIDLDELSAILESVAEPDELLASDQPVRSVPAAAAADGWGVPMLDPALQALEIYPPRKWGTFGRATPLPGCLLHFYTDDSKFTALLKDSSPVIEAAPAAVVETNFSTSAHMPGALALYRIYQKRTLSAAWQAHGIPVIVDLNVDRAWFDLALLGVPVGWRAYANRAQTTDLDHLVEAFDLACTRRGGDDVFYLVYGGGAKARAFCEDRGWVWLPEQSDTKRGRRVGARS